MVYSDWMVPHFWIDPDLKTQNILCSGILTTIMNLDAHAWFCSFASVIKKTLPKRGLGSSSSDSRHGSVQFASVKIQLNCQTDWSNSDVGWAQNLNEALKKNIHNEQV